MLPLRHVNCTHTLLASHSPSPHFHHRLRLTVRSAEGASPFDIKPLDLGARAARPSSKKRKQPEPPLDGDEFASDMESMIRRVSSKLAASKPQSKERKKYWHKMEMLMLVDLTRQADALVEGREVDLFTELSSDFETEADCASGAADCGDVKQEEWPDDQLLSTPRRKAAGFNTTGNEWTFSRRGVGAMGAAGAVQEGGSLVTSAAGGCAEPGPGPWMATSVISPMAVDIGGGLDDAGLQVPSPLVRPSPFEARKLFPLSPSSPPPKQQRLSAGPDEFWANILPLGDGGC